MYSPRIYDKFIPHLYKWAKEEKLSMTALVNRIIKNEIEKYQAKESEHDEQDKRNPEWDSANL
jgi:hypothetical protein